MALKVAVVVWLMFVAFLAGVAASEMAFSERRAEILDRLELQKTQVRQRLMDLEGRR